MALTVKAITLWRKEIENKPGELAGSLAPLVATGADFQVLMGYRYPGNESKAAIELFPVSGRKVVAAATAGGLSASEIPCLLVEGDNRPGIAQGIAKAIADAGINLTFVVAQSIGRRYSAVFGFENEADTRKAAPVIRKAGSARRR